MEGKKFSKERFSSRRSIVDEYRRHERSEAWQFLFIEKSSKSLKIKMHRKKTLSMLEWSLRSIPIEFFT
jgi:hypothetical protein